MAVLQLVEGPVSAAELVDFFHRTMEEQGLAFESDRARREEMIRADSRLREEQDADIEALRMDREKENLRNSASTERVHQKPVKALNTRNYEKPNKNKSASKHNSKVHNPTTATQNQNKGVPNRAGQCQPTQILIRFPKGQRRARRFQSTDRIQAIFAFIDSLGMPGIGNTTNWCQTSQEECMALIR